jgi:hypothetical protein
MIYIYKYDNTSHRFYHFISSRIFQCHNTQHILVTTVSVIMSIKILIQKKKKKQVFSENLSVVTMDVLINICDRTGNWNSAWL